MGGTGQMLQQVTVIYFDTLEKANRFVNSTEGGLFDDPYGDGQDNFEYTTYAGDPKLPFLISTILKNHFGFKENSHLVGPHLLRGRLLPERSKGGTCITNQIIISVLSFSY